MAYQANPIKKYVGVLLTASVVGGLSQSANAQGQFQYDSGFASMATLTIPFGGVRKPPVTLEFAVGKDSSYSRFISPRYTRLNALASHYRLPVFEYNSGNSILIARLEFDTSKFDLFKLNFSDLGVSALEVGGVGLPLRKSIR